MTKPSYFIVSCDGGGIRGLITAMLLEDLDGKCTGFLNKVDAAAWQDVVNWVKAAVAAKA